MNKFFSLFNVYINKFLKRIPYMKYDSFIIISTLYDTIKKLITYIIIYDNTMTI